MIQTYSRQIKDILLRQPTISHISFDIFDTLITRTVEYPEDIFKILEKSLIDKKLISEEMDFFDTRIACHKEAYRLLAGDSEEITFDLVYDLMANKLSMDKNLVETIKKIELNIERNMLVPIPETIDILNLLRTEKKQIVFTSDMYLSSEFLTSLLRDLQIFKPNDTIFLSSETGLRKSSGKLFNFVLKHENIKPKQLLHIGDNIKSDVKIPKKIGITTMYYTKKHFQQTSSFIQVQTDSQYDLFDGFIHKCSSIAYDNLILNKKVNHDLVEFATYIAAPLLFSYTLWILETAKKNGINNLYFLSRDGQILYHIAKIIIDKRKDFSINCHYLYASRQLWHLPSIGSSIGDDEFEWLLQGIKNNFNDILEKVNLKYSAIEKYAKRFGLEADTSIGSLEVQTIKQFFLEPDIVSLVAEKAKEKREILLKYFEQENFLDSIDIAIVDLGWHGNLQKSLRKILNIGYENNTYLIHGFYMKLIQNNSSQKDKTYIFLKNNTIDKPMPLILEFFATADHNSALGLQIKNDSIQPRFAEVLLDPLFKWGVKDWQMSILEYSTILAESDFTFLHIDTLAYRSIKNYYGFYEHPKRSYLNILSRYPFSYEQSGEKILQIVKKQDFHYLLYLLRIEKKYHPGLWWEGSYYFSNPLYKLLFYPLYLLKKFNKKD